MSRRRSGPPPEPMSQSDYQSLDIEKRTKLRGDRAVWRNVAENIFTLMRQIESLDVSLADALERSDALLKHARKNDRDGGH